MYYFIISVNDLRHIASNMFEDMETDKVFGIKAGIFQLKIF